MIKRFKYKGWKVSIEDYKTSWDKKITMKRGKQKIVVIYNMKHLNDAIKKAMKDINKK